MIQNRSKILIKDNSGIVRGRTIQAGRARTQSLGGVVKFSITKAKSNWSSKTKGQKSRPLQDVVLISSKKPMLRLDGCGLKFQSNHGVTVGRSGKKMALGFKRINGVVPFELKKSTHHGASLGMILKLARNQV